MNKSIKDLKLKNYQCRYCGMIRGTYTSNLPHGQYPARKKPKVGLAPHSWTRITIGCMTADGDFFDSTANIMFALADVGIHTTVLIRVFRRMKYGCLRFFLTAR